MFGALFINKCGNFLMTGVYVPLYVHIHGSQLVIFIEKPFSPYLTIEVVLHKMQNSQSNVELPLITMSIQFDVTVISNIIAIKWT